MDIVVKLRDGCRCVICGCDGRVINNELWTAHMVEVDEMKRMSPVQWVKLLDALPHWNFGVPVV
jgi:succinate dehydrogenase/fumarate reductase-like Fe-S protein